MKKIYIVLILIFATFTGFSQTQVPNQYFENWHTISDPNDSLENWSTAVFYDLGGLWGVIRVPTAEQEASDVFQGSFSVKMECYQEQYSGILVPGMMQLGNLVVSDDDMDINGGYPFADRPLGMSFYAKYQPATADTAFMLAYLTKYNSSTNSSDTIGASMYLFTETLADYTKILLPFAYQSEDMPDTINIIFISTNPENMKVGSTLWVDSLYMKYDFDAYPTFTFAATNVTDTSFVANWFPLPGAVNYSLDVATDTNFVQIIPEYNDLIVSSYSQTVNIPDAYQDEENYFYRVRVNYTNTTSINSNVTAVKLSYPTVCLTATEVTSTSFRAHWLPRENAQSYNFQLAGDMMFTNLVSGYENLNVLDTTTVVSGLEVDSLYYYRVQTVYSFGLSPFSNVMSQLTLNLTSFKDFNSYFVKDKVLYIHELSGNSEINVYDVTGRNIISTVSNSSSVEIPFNTSGIYVVIIKDNEENYRFKISL